MSQDILYHQLDQFVQAFLPLFTTNQQSSIINNWSTFTQLIQSKPPLDYDKIHMVINKMRPDEEEHQSQNTRSSVGNPTPGPSRANTLPQNEERNQSCSKNLSQGKGGSTITAASSPRLISTVSKNTQNSTSNSSVTGTNNLLNKFSQLDSMQSPKVALSNLASQQQLQKNSLQTQLRVNQQADEFNRHLLLSKTKELLFTLSVSTDKLNAMARLPMFSHQKENMGLTPKSPLKTHSTNTTLQQLQSYQLMGQQQHLSNTSQQMQFGYSLQNQVYQPMYVNNGGVKPRGSNHSAEHYSIPQRAII